MRSVLKIFGALIGAGTLALVWFLIIWPMLIEPAIADRKIAIVKSVLRKGMTRAEVDAMVGKQIPQPITVGWSPDHSHTMIEYHYKDDLRTSYTREVDIKWVHDRIASWDVVDWGTSCFN